MKEELQSVLQRGDGLQHLVSTKMNSYIQRLMLRWRRGGIIKKYRARNLKVVGVPKPDKDDMTVGKACGLQCAMKVFSDLMKVDSLCRSISLTQ